jgi:maltose alpha-D-glucosyltransferase/alpha-amylase
VSSAAPTGPITVSPIGGDASNTSIVVRSGSTGWIIKLFRRCRAGIQPEVEIGEFLATASPWQDTPRLCGWLEYVPADDQLAASSTAIATVHEFAPGYTTGWDRLVGLLTAGDGLAGHSGDEVLAIVADLGRATARMHRAFSARPDIPAFAPESATPVGRQAAALRMSEHAQGVFALIESRLPQVEPTMAGRLAAVLDARSRLVSRFDRLPGIALAATNIRVHGDYHLGQVLVAEHESNLLVAEQGGVLVIDFEGEPGRTLAERREKTATAKDVAGMCRSFDYLLRHVAKSSARPYAAADLARLEACYLGAYREGAAGQPWWPTDPAAADALLAVFKLDKAIYELAYELNNRPDWIDVPLAAIEENRDGSDFPFHTL